MLSEFNIDLIEQIIRRKYITKLKYLVVKPLGHINITCS